MFWKATKIPNFALSWGSNSNTSISSPVIFFTFNFQLVTSYDGCHIIAIASDDFPDPFLPRIQ